MYVQEYDNYQLFSPVNVYEIISPSFIGCWMQAVQICAITNPVLFFLNNFNLFYTLLISNVVVIDSVLHYLPFTIDDGIF